METTICLLVATPAIFYIKKLIIYTQSHVMVTTTSLFVVTPATTTILSNEWVKRSVAIPGITASLRIHSRLN